MLSLMTISEIVGWCYGILWGAAYWPPVLNNAKHRSVQGLSIDFLYFNFLGYLLYSFYFCMLKFNSTIRNQFSNRYSITDIETYPLVDTNDVAFAIHGLIMSLIALSQPYFWGYKKNHNQTLSAGSKWITAILVLGITLIAGYIYATDNSNSLGLEWLDLLIFLGVTKVAMSLCKNVPQIYYNYNRKSTKGWPVQVVWLQSSGAFLSLVQLLLDAIIAGHPSAIMENPPKLFLGTAVLLCMFIMSLQHYRWYRDSYDADDETVPLLQKSPHNYV